MKSLLTGDFFHLFFSSNVYNPNVLLFVMGKLKSDYNTFSCNQRKMLVRRLGKIAGKC